MPVASELLVRIGADTAQAERGIQRVDRQVANFGRGAGAAGALASAAFVGVGVAALGMGAGFGASVASAATFEQTISKVGAVSGATQTELAGLSQLALQMGAQTSFSASEAAQAMRELAAGGIEVSQMANVLPGTLNLAAAGGLGLAEAATIATDSMAIFASQGVTMDQIANAFAGAANISSISVQDMAESMKYAGPVAASMGLSLEDTSAAIALLGANGLKGSQAGTGLRTMLVSLASPSKEAAGLMRELGINVFDSSGKIKDFAGISDELRDSLKGMTDQQRLATLETLFGREGVSAAIAMMGEGENSIQSYTQKLREAATAEATGKAMLDNFSGSMEQLKGSVETAAITLGLAFLPVLRQVVDAATAGVNAALPLIEAYGPRLAAGLQAGIVGLVALVSAFVSTAQSVAAVVSGAHSATVAIAGFSGPFAGAAAAAVNLYTQFLTLIPVLTQVRDFFAGLPTPLLAVAAGFVALGPAVQLVGAVLPLLVGAFTGLGPIVSLLTSSLPLLGSVIAALGWPVTLLVAAVAGLGVAWMTNFMGIQSATMPIIQQIGALITGTLLPALTQLGAYITTTVVPAFLAGWAQVQAGVTAAAAIIVPAAQQMGEAVVAAVQSALPGLQAFGAGFMELVGAVAPIAREVGGAILASLGPAMAALGEWGATAIPQFAAAFSNLARMTGEGIGIMAQVVGAGLAQIAGFIETHKETIVATLTAAWGVISNIVGSHLTIISTLVSAGMQALAGDWQGAWQTIQAGVTTAMGQVGAAVQSGIALVQATLGTVLGAIVADVAGKWAEVVAAVQTALAAMLGAAQSGAAAVVSAITGAFGQLPGFVTGIMGAFAGTVLGALGGLAGSAGAAAAGIGSAIVQGIAGALQAGAGTLAGIASSMVQSALDAAKGALGIKSPSREFAYVGEMAIQGLIAGMDDKKLDATQKAAQVASAVAKAALDAMSAMTAIASFDFAKNSPTGDQLGWLSHLVSSLVATIERAAEGFSKEGLEATSRFADSAGRVGGMIKSAVDGLLALGKANFAESSPTGSAMGWFAHLVTSIVATVREASLDFTAEGLAAVGQFADAASKVTGLVKGGVDALAALTKYADPPRAAIYAFGKTIRALVNDLALVAEQVTQEATDAAAKFAGGAGAAVTLIGNGVGAFLKLAEYEDPPRAAIYAFGKTLRAVINDFALLSQQITPAATAAAATFAEGAGKAVGILGSGVSGFAALSTFVAPASSAVYAFGKVVRAVVNDLALVAEQVGQEATEAAAAFANGAGSVLKIIGDGVGGLMQLAEFVAPSKESIDRFVYAAQYLVQKIGQMAGIMGSEALTQATAFGAAAGSVFNAAKTGIEVFKGFENLTIPSAEAIDALGYAMAYVVRKMGEIAAAIGTAGLRDAQAFSTVAAQAFGSVKAGIEALTNVAKMKDDATKAFDLLLGGMQDAIERAQSMVQYAKNLKTEAEEYAKLMADTARLFAEGMAAVGATPSGTPSQIGPRRTGGGSGSLLTLAPSGPGSVLPVSNLRGGGGGGQAIVVNINAPTYGVDQLQDVVVSAVTSAQRRGRL